MARRKTVPHTPTFVVYVRFPNSVKEYCYLCRLPNITVGSQVIANGTPVTVHRIASFDSIATKYVTSAEDHLKESRRRVIHDRLVTIERELQLQERYRALARKSPEARRLLKELESL